jgi:hypothetical protein
LVVVQVGGNGWSPRSVAEVARLALLRLVLQVMRQLRCQHALSPLLLQLPGQARFAENRLGILVLDLPR